MWIDNLHKLRITNLRRTHYSTRRWICGKLTVKQWFDYEQTYKYILYWKFAYTHQYTLTITGFTQYFFNVNLSHFNSQWLVTWYFCQIRSCVLWWNVLWCCGSVVLWCWCGSLVLWCSVGMSRCWGHVRVVCCRWRLLLWYDIAFESPHSRSYADIQSWSVLTFIYTIMPFFNRCFPLSFIRLPFLSNNDFILVFFCVCCNPKIILPLSLFHNLFSTIYFVTKSFFYMFPICLYTYIGHLI